MNLNNQKEYIIKHYGELNKIQKKEAITTFVEGFRHLLTFTKSDEELISILKKGLDSELVLVCLEGEQVLGILGMATYEARPIRFELNACIKVFGKFRGTIISKQMNGVMQKQIVKNPMECYVDVLATAKEARGKGVATHLLNYVFALDNYEYYTIEVLSKNTNAKRLYEYVGFVEVKKNRFSFLSLLGYGYPIKMKK